MKKFNLIILTVLFLCSFTRMSYSQTLDPNTLNYIDSLVNSSYSESSPGISLIIAKDGIPVYKKARGMADIELNVSLSPENVFAIGSMTKQVTAVCILQLIHEGKLNLNDDIKKILPDYNTHGRTITVENCLTHTSGIPSFTEKNNFGDMYQKKMTRSEIVNFFQNDTLLFEPGSDFSYSNSGYYLLGLIIEKLSGMDYEKYVQKNIFDKSNMTHSYFESAEKIIPMRASGYDGQDSLTLQNASYYERSWAMGAGNIMSTTGDLLLWDNALYTDKIVPRSLLEKAWTPFMTSNGFNSNYSYGWNVTPLDKYTNIEHGGAINGYLSGAIRIPEQHLYIAALTNTTRISPDNITHKVLMKILGISDERPKSISIGKNSLTEFVGTYEVQREGGRVLKNYSNDKQYRHIFIQGDSLMLQRTGGSKLSLIPYAKDKFITNVSEKRFDFVRDNKGEIIALDVYNYPVNFGPHDYCHKVNVPMNTSRKEVTISAEVMKKFEGEYELHPGFNLAMFIEDGKLFTQATGQQKIELFPESETRFFMKVVDAQVEFIADPDGSVNKVILTQGQKFECKRIK